MRFVRNLVARLARAAYRMCNPSDVDVLDLRHSSVGDELWLHKIDGTQEFVAVLEKD